MQLHVSKKGQCVYRSSCFCAVSLNPEVENNKLWGVIFE